MVYTNRTEKCSSSQESASEKTSSTSGSTYQASFGSNSSSATNSSKPANNAWSKNASDNDKWKYNNMARDDRDKFNSMHFS